MRHDLAAFRELDTLVRNLSDQLAGYRRRALSAESRVRELELAADELRLASNRAADRADSAVAELEATGEALRVEREASNTARLMVQDLSRTVAESRSVSEGTAPSPTERATSRDNAELRRRLEEASVRTRELSERLRFLRQQLATVPEK